MNNKKSTKRTLVSSVLSLVLCVAMLVGTTFAWFTDIITSGRNTIQSGNLDVELYYSVLDEDGKWTEYKEVTATTDIFGYDLWEPGYTEIAKFKVVNEGSLALKYQLTADVYAETSGINKAGATFVLSDYIKTAVVDTDATRSEILALVGNDIKGSLAMSAKSLAAGAEEELGFAIWMPTSVGNEANHNGVNIPSIEFGINLVATQEMAESDSFGKDYDTNATYPGEVASASELIRALKNNENIKLAANIDLSGMTWTPIASYSGVLDGAGHKISNLTGTNGLFTTISGATIKNLTLADVSITASDNRTGAVAGQIDKIADAPQTIIENVTVTGTVKGGQYYTGGLVGADRSYDTLIIDCVNSADVTGENQVGGIVGQANRKTVIDNCVNNGDIKATNIIAGGIVGLIAGDDKGDNTDLRVTVMNSHNTGVISEDSDSFGDLTGGIAGAVGRDGGDPVHSMITAYILNCDVTEGQKIYGAKYNYLTGDGSLITVIEGEQIAEGVYEQGTRNYYIADAKGLVNVYSNVIPQNKEQGQSVNLMDDIDLSGMIWEPVSNMHHTFNGNGYTISNVTCKEGRRSGFFGYAGGVTVNDLTLENVIAAGSQAGIFAGSGEGFKANNCYLKGVNKVTYYATSEEWNGIGAITGVITGSNINVEIVAGTTVTVDKGDMATKCTYFDELTGYLNANAGTVVNHGTVTVVEEAIDYTVKGLDVKLTSSSYNSITYNKHDDGATVNSIEVYCADDLASVAKMVSEGVMKNNGQNDIHAKVIFKSNIDFGGKNFVGLSKDFDIEGNGYMLSNVSFEANAGGKAGLIPYAGNNKISGITLKDVTVNGAQAGVFAGNASNVHLTDCALAGDITVNGVACASEAYNGVGAVFGVIAEGACSVDVDTSDANITVNWNNLAPKDNFAKESSNLVGVVYGGSYTIN